jgi:transposase
VREKQKSQRARGIAGHRIFTLVGAVTGSVGFEVWIGDAAEIKKKRVRKQKTDREDVRILLKLLLENRFPRIWVQSPENRDVRQLLWHRHRLVQRRTRSMNPLKSNCSEVSGRYGDGRRPQAVHMMGEGAMKSGSSKCARS